MNQEFYMAKPELNVCQLNDQTSSLKYRTIPSNNGRFPLCICAWASVKTQQVALIGPTVRWKTISATWKSAGFVEQSALTTTVHPLSGSINTFVYS